jgi:hypothetical protein
VREFWHGTGVIDIERIVSASGNVTVGNHVISAGSQLAGQRVTLRLDGPVAHILANGSPVRTVACPVPQSAQHRLPGPLTVTRRVSVRGAIMIGGQRIQAGLPHAGQTASITIGSGTCQITVPERLTMTAPRTTSRDILRHKASNYQP